MNGTKLVMRVGIMVMQRLSLFLFAALALGLVCATLLAGFGIIPWATLPLAWSGAPVTNAGMFVQIGLTAFALSLCFFLPANGRMMRLEASHRRFEIGINDITRAYHAAHAADREGLFRSGEAFEDMRDRVGFLNEHPDLEQLEPELLALAAKMSHVSLDLAEAYSDDRVNRARSFLKERQHEVDRFNDRLAHARAIHSEFSTWITRIELEENVARAQMERLLDELETMLPELNTPQPVTKIPRAAKVTHLQHRAE